MEEVKTYVLNIEKAHWVTRAILFFFAALGILGPILGAILFYFQKEDFPLVPFAISSLFFGLAGWWLLRMALWNTYGKEVFKIVDKNNLEYFTDYGWFKEKAETLSLTTLRIESVHDIEKNGKSAILLLNTDKKIESSKLLNKQELDDFVSFINSCLA